MNEISSSRRHIPFMNRLNPLHLCFTSYFFVGWAMVLFPSMMPVVIDELNLNLVAAGIVFPVMAMGAFIGGYGVGGIGDKVGQRTVLCFSALLFATGFIVAALARGLVFFLIGFTIIGCGRGAASTAINAFTAVTTPEQRRGRALNFLHGVYSVGSAVSPLLIAGLLSYVIGWRSMLFLSALIWLIISALVLRFQEPRSTVHAKTPNSFGLSLFRNRLFALSFVVAFIYNAVAWSLLGWINVYTQQLGYVAPILSTGMISLFYIALTVGRFTCAHIADRFGYGKTLFWCALGTVIVYPLLIVDGNVLTITGGVLLSGLFIAGVYPTSLAYSNTLFPETIGAVTGTMSVAMTLGTMIPPWWTGLMAEVWSFPRALAWNYVFVIGLLFVAWYIMLHGNNEHSTSTNEL